MAEVVLKNVIKRFGKVTAVNNISFSIGNKEFYVLVGPSGCGKTTTLRMIAGLEEITEGEIYIDGKVVNDLPPKDRNISMVFQNYALYPHMSVFDNMSFGLRLKKYTNEEITERVDDTSRILAIKNLLGRQPKELSGGQKQRVAVGRAIVRKPKVFLFDEPLSNLDARLRVEMRVELKKLHQKIQATIIYVTHDQVEAMTLGDKIVVMKDGVIQQIAAPLILYTKPVNKFVAGFIGSPAMNFIDCRIIKKNNNLWLDEGNFIVKIPEDFAEELEGNVDKEVIFGIRPEYIFDRLCTSMATPENTVRITVDVVELLGSEKLLGLVTQKSRLIARVNPFNQAELGQNIEVVFDMSKMHIFNKDTEQAII